MVHYSDAFISDFEQLFPYYGEMGRSSPLERTTRRFKTAPQT